MCWNFYTIFKDQLAQRVKLLFKTKRLLEKVTCPTLMIQAEDDDTVKKKSVEYIYQHLSSEKKVMKHFSKGGHAVLLCSTGEQGISYIAEYINEYC